jgi:hypothetical protein
VPAPFGPAERGHRALCPALTDPPPRGILGRMSTTTRKRARHSSVWSTSFRAGAVLAAVIAVSAGAAAQSFLDGTALAARCGESEDQPFCLGYVAGVTDAMASGGAINRIRICLPEGVTLDQLRDATTQFVDANTTKQHLEGARVVAEALKDAFPCR